MPAALSARIVRIAQESHVPECWACTLLRVSIRLRPVVFACGAIAGFVMGAMLTAWVLV
jgi:hypothetical protein